MDYTIGDLKDNIVTIYVGIDNNMKITLPYYIMEIIPYLKDNVRMNTIHLKKNYDVSISSYLGLKYVINSYKNGDVYCDDIDIMYSMFLWLVYLKIPEVRYPSSFILKFLEHVDFDKFDEDEVNTIKNLLP